jgi:hypothetical protein
MGSNAKDIIAAYPNSKPIADDIVALAKKLGMPDAGWLANLINFESGGTFSPSIRNPHSGATGLIQFMPSTAKGMGTTTDTLASMSAKEQMKYVERYLLRKKRNADSYKQPTDAYMAVFYPVAMGKGKDFSIAEHYASQRAAKDTEAYQRHYDYVVRINGGIVTAGDYAEKANRNARLPTGLTGIQIGNTGIRVLPILLGTSVTLLGLAIYIRIAQPEWASFLNRRG